VAANAAATALCNHRWTLVVASSMDRCLPSPTHATMGDMTENYQLRANSPCFFQNGQLGAWLLLGQRGTDFFGYETFSARLMRLISGRSVKYGTPF